MFMTRPGCSLAQEIAVLPGDGGRRRLVKNVNGTHKRYIYTSLFTNMVAHKKKIQTYKQKAV